MSLNTRDHVLKATCRKIDDCLLLGRAPLHRKMHVVFMSFLFKCSMSAMTVAHTSRIPTGGLSKRSPSNLLLEVGNRLILRRVEKGDLV